MTEIILSQVGQTITADSRDVAENFGKQHKHVLETIENLIEQTSAENPANLFIESRYPDRYGRDQKCYLMNRDGFSLLVMGFTGREALAWKLKYIEAFNKMESAIRENGIPKNFAEALRLAADQQEKIEEARKALDAAKPAILFTESVKASNTSILIGELAKILKQNGLDIGQNRLFEKLRADGFLIRRAGSDYNMPTQRAMELKLFDIKETAITHSDGHVTVTKTVKVTGKGQVYFVNLYVKREE